MTLVFEDHFDGTTINRTKWPNVFNDYWSPWPKVAAVAANATVSNSILKLKFTSGGNSYGKQYSGTGLENETTFPTITQGRIEARARFPPTNSGVIGYIAAYSEGWPPEIDFAESVCDKANTISFTQHWGQHINGYHPSQEARATIDETQFHIYTLDISNTELKWFIDRKLITTQKNNSVGRRWHPTMGVLTYCSSINVSLPVYMEVDYVKVWDSIPTDTPIPDPVDPCKSVKDQLLQTQEQLQNTKTQLTDAQNKLKQIREIIK